MEQQEARRGDEPLTLAQAVREARGLVSYQQLWRGIKAGRIEACQPSGPNGAYKVTRSELERVTQPVRPRAGK
jgi:hypothetical protein